MSVSLTINSGKHIFCPITCSEWVLVPIWLFYLICACIQDWIVTDLSNWNPILVPQTSYHLIKLRSISIYRYGKLHVQVCVIIHIWGEVLVILCHNGVIDYFIKNIPISSDCVPGTMTSPIGCIFSLLYVRSSSSLKRLTI